MVALAVEKALPEKALASERNDLSEQDPYAGRRESSPTCVHCGVSAHPDRHGDRHLKAYSQGLFTFFSGSLFFKSSTTFYNNAQNPRPSKYSSTWASGEIPISYKTTAVWFSEHGRQAHFAVRVSVSKFKKAPCLYHHSDSQPVCCDPQRPLENMGT